MAISSANTSNAQVSNNNTQANGRRRGNQEQEEALGFLNLVITDKHGKEHSIRATIPLLESNRVHAAMINAARNNPGQEFNIVGKVNLVSNEEIELF